LVTFGPKLSGFGGAAADALAAGAPLAAPLLTALPLGFADVVALGFAESVGFPEPAPAPPSPPHAIHKEATPARSAPRVRRTIFIGAQSTESRVSHARSETSAAGHVERDDRPTRPGGGVRQLPHDLVVYRVRQPEVGPGILRGAERNELSVTATRLRATRAT
jgi:hypothetical protein